MNYPIIPDLKIRKASHTDLPVVQRLLSSVHLPVAGADRHITNFLVSESGGELIGAIGLEVYGETGLLRSAAVLPQYQNKGIGDRLFSMIVDYAKELGIRELVLLTTTAKEYFLRKGFSPIERDNITETIMASEQFKGACPATATVMKRKL